MNDEHDPFLSDAFASAERTLEDDAFVADVMTRASTLGRRRWLVALAVGAAAVPVLWLLAAPLNALVLEVLELIAQPVARSEGWVGTVLSPLNSVASLLALGLLAARAIYRRLSTG